MIRMEVSLGNGYIAIGAASFKNGDGCMTIEETMYPVPQGSKVSKEDIDLSKKIFIRVPDIASVEVLEQSLEIIKKNLIKREEENAQKGHKDQTESEGSSDNSRGSETSDQARKEDIGDSATNH